VDYGFLLLNIVCAIPVLLSAALLVYIFHEIWTEFWELRAHRMHYKRVSKWLTEDEFNHAKLLGKERSHV
jgi:hypothetical protein